MKGVWNTCAEKRNMPQKRYREEKEEEKKCTDEFNKRIDDNEPIRRQ